MITMSNWRERMVEDMRLHDLRPRTVEGYALAVRLFLERTGKNPEDATEGMFEGTSCTFETSEGRRRRASTSRCARCGSSSCTRSTARGKERSSLPDVRVDDLAARTAALPGAMRRPHRGTCRSGPRARGAGTANGGGVLTIRVRSTSSRDDGRR